jgi:hypothetical protein
MGRDEALETVPVLHDRREAEIAMSPAREERDEPEHEDEDRQNAQENPPLPWLPAPGLSFAHIILRANGD